MGETARARKGTGWNNVAWVMEHVDKGWSELCVIGGFGSGEAVVDRVADPSDDDPVGATDKRVLVREGEFAHFLAVCNREGSTLSETARNAWDGKKLESRTRTHKTIVATTETGTSTGTATGHAQGRPS